MTYLYAPVNKAYIFILRHSLTNWQRSTKNMRSNHVGTQERVIYQACADQEWDRGIRTPNLGPPPPPHLKIQTYRGMLNSLMKVPKIRLGSPPPPSSSGIQSYHQTPYLGVGVPIMNKNLIKHYDNCFYPNRSLPTSPGLGLWLLFLNIQWYSIWFLISLSVWLVI